jgi:DNA-directed RNA polymerase subunit E'/Rpb7
MDTYTITSTIEIEPKYLHSGIKDIITKKISEKYCKKSVQKYGYVIEVNNVNVLSNQMSRVNLNVMFNVRFTLNCFNPTEGKELDSKVLMVFDHGIMCEEYGVRILIPKTSFDGTIKDGIVKIKTGTKDGKLIKKDDIIRICLMTVKYDKRNFSAIANLI